MCDHNLWVDALKMIETKDHGLVAKPVKACLVCHEIIMEMPE